MVMQQIKRMKGVLPSCSKSPLPTTNVATAISIMRNIHAGLFKKPSIRKRPPKNSDVLQSQALKSGNGIFSVCKKSAKFCMLLVCKMDIP